MTAPPPEPETGGSRVSHVGGGGDETELATALASSGDVSSSSPSDSHSSRAVSHDLERSLEADEPTRIDRYAVLQRLGAGGMGVVFAAYDTELDRKVALKLIRPGQREGSVSESGGARMLREAKALAKLSHRNVVQIYDVGRFRDEVFIAMEFVRGQTLRTWLRDRDRSSWREIVRILAAAGRGLAAAHDAGLVHRDFKPANVIVREGGGVKVLDFGLARREGIVRARPPATDDPEATRDEEGTEGFAGTPAYMAPEQISGGQVDARCDQFAFCVVLHEAIYGVRPQMGLLKQDPPTPPDQVGRAPKWMWAVIARGLSPDPSGRFESMHELLHELSPNRRRFRKRTLLIAFGGVALLATAYLGGRDDAGRVGVCEGARERLEGVWDPGRRAEVAAAFEGSRLPHAASAFSGVAAALDEYADGWVDTHRQACLASHRGEQSAAMLDRRMACLDRRRAELRATVEALAESGGEVANEGIDLQATLPDLAYCSDLAALEAAVTPPEDPALRAKAEEIGAMGIEVDALERTGQVAAARTEAKRAFDQAVSLGVASVEAERALGLGRVERSMADYASAHEHLERAYLRALASGHDLVLEEATLALFRLHADDLGDESASHWGSVAAAAVERHGSTRAARFELLRLQGDVLARGGDQAGALARFAEAIALFDDDSEFPESITAAAVYEEMSDVHANVGRFAEATELTHQALRIRETRQGVAHPSLIPVLVELAFLQDRRGESREALATVDRALAIVISAYGENHREVATLLNTASATLTRVGRYEEAGDNYERAVEILSRLLPADHPDIAMILVNWASVRMEQERYDEAMELNARALAMIAKARGERDAAVGTIRNNMGSIRELQGRYEEALELYRSAYEIWLEDLGGEAPNIPIALYNLGTTSHRLGREREAERYIREAIAAQTALTHEEHPSIGLFRCTLGAVLGGRGEVDEGIASLDAGLRIMALDPEITEERLSEGRFELAKVLHESRRDRARARELAEAAARGYRTGAKAKRLAEVEAWLAATQVSPPKSSRSAKAFSGIRK